MIEPTAPLKILAEAYCAATGITLAALGTRVCRNHKFFKRIIAGAGCHSGAIKPAFDWFAANWPPEAPWPEGVPAPIPDETAEAA